MCGRFAYWDSSHIQETYRCNRELSIDTNYNACPTRHIPVIVAHLRGSNAELTRSLEVMRWGLIPDWANIDQHKGFINARSETITQKQSFKESFKIRRCIVPAMGYYEWDDKRQPHFISNDKKQLCFAAIWDGGNAGIHPSVAILTMQSSTLKYIHERCPLVLQSEESIDQWLNPMSSQETLLQLIKNASDSGYIAHKVDKKVGNPSINTPSLIDEITTI